jgi:hypothetical protein
MMTIEVAVGKLPAKLGLTKPPKRAYERDPAAIEACKLDTSPSIAKRANRHGAKIYFWDESSFRGDALRGTTCSAKGKTLVLRCRANDGRSRRCVLLTPKLRFWFATYQWVSIAELFTEMLKILMKGHRRSLVLHPRLFPCTPHKDRERLCRVDERDIAVLLSARLRTKAESGRIGLELHEANRDSKACTRERRVLEQPKGLATSVRLLGPLGDASYSTYLVHGLVLTMLLRTWVTTFEAPSACFVAVGVALATVDGFAVHVLMEDVSCELRAVCGALSTE